MRYDKRVTLSLIGDSKYDPDTGKTIKPEQVIYTDMPCHRSPLSPQSTAVTFGNVQRDVSLIRLQGQVTDKINHAYMGDREYTVVRHTYYRHDTVMYLEQVNNGKG